MQVSDSLKNSTHVIFAETAASMGETEERVLSANCDEDEGDPNYELGEGDEGEEGDTGIEGDEGESDEAKEDIDQALDKAEREVGANPFQNFHF